MLKIFINKEIELEVKEMAVMAALNGLYSNKQENLVTSISSIAYFLSGKFLDKSVKKDRSIAENIKVGIQSLEKRKIISVIEQNGENYVFAKDGLEVDTEKVKFVVVELWEIQKIFSVAKMPFNVFSFFVNLIGTINNATKEWHMSQDEMTMQWGYSKRTVNDYLEQLSDMKLIYLHKSKKRRTDGTFHKINNSYGRYADASMVIQSAEKYIATVECEDICEKVDRRAIKLRYNAFCNGAKKYQDNIAAVQSLIKECRLYNKSLDYRPIETYDSDSESKQAGKLDLSVFEDYMSDFCEPNNSDDQWGEPDPIIDFTIEEILEMPIMTERVTDGTGSEDMSWLDDEEFADLF